MIKNKKCTIPTEIFDPMFCCPDSLILKIEDINCGTRSTVNCCPECPYHTDYKPRGRILNKALDIINGERLDVYGKPEDSFEIIGKYWTTYLQANGLITGSGALISPQEVAEMMMLFKIARMSGQKPIIDNYVDLAGYAAIAADMVDTDGL